MRNNERKQSNAIEEAAITAVSAASATPFWTALKITLGIAVGQLISAALGLGTLIVFGMVVYAMVKS